MYHEPSAILYEVLGTLQGYENARVVAQLVVHVAEALGPVHLPGLAHPAAAVSPALGGGVGALPLAARVVVAHPQVVPDLVGNGLEVVRFLSGYHNKVCDFLVISLCNSSDR